METNILDFGLLETCMGAGGFRGLRVDNLSNYISLILLL